MWLLWVKSGHLHCNRRCPFYPKSDISQLIRIALARMKCQRKENGIVSLPCPVAKLSSHDALKVSIAQQRAEGDHGQTACVVRPRILSPSCGKPSMTPLGAEQKTSNTLCFVPANCGMATTRSNNWRCSSSVILCGPSAGQR